MMDAFIEDKPRHETNNEERYDATTRMTRPVNDITDEESTEVKLAMR